MDYRGYRTLKTLAQTKGWLTRWKLVRKALDHMSLEEREVILTSLKEGGLIEERMVWKEQGPGARALQYRLTKAGLKVCKTLSVEGEKVCSSPSGFAPPPVKPGSHRATNVLRS